MRGIEEAKIIVDYCLLNVEVTVNGVKYLTYIRFSH